MAENKLEIDILVNDKEALAKLRGALQSVENESRKTTDGMSAGFITAGAAIAASVISVQKIISVMKEAVAAASEQEDAINRLNISMRLQGTFSQDLSEKYQKMASALQSATRFSDEAILQVQERLSTVGNVMPIEMAKATTATLNLASALRIDLGQASDIVAKAVSGNTNMLTRQLPVLKDLITESTTAGEILDILNQKFGGAAQEDVKSYSGAHDKLKNAIGEVLEALGDFVVKSPEVQQAMNASADAALRYADSIKKIREEGSASQMVMQAIQNIMMSGPAGFGLSFGQATGRTLVESFTGSPAENARIAQENNKVLQNAMSVSMQARAGMAAREGAMLAAKQTAQKVALKEQFLTEIQMAQATADLVSAVASLSGKSSIKAVAIVVQAVVTAVNIMMTTVNPFLALLTIATTAVSAAASISQLNQAEAALDAARSQQVTAVTNIPGFARGVTNFQGGLAVVGEQGPELVSLPRGSNVHPSGSLGGVQIHIEFNGNIQASEESAQEFARMVGKEVSAFIDYERERL